MSNLRSASTLISGIGSVGVEIAKNLILGGVRRVTIHDTKATRWNDLSAQVSTFLSYLMSDSFVLVLFKRERRGCESCESQFPEARRVKRFRALFAERISID